MLHPTQLPFKEGITQDLPFSYQQAILIDEPVNEGTQVASFGDYDWDAAGDTIKEKASTSWEFLSEDVGGLLKKAGSYISDLLDSTGFQDLSSAGQILAIGGLILLFWGGWSIINAGSRIFGFFKLLAGLAILGVGYQWYS